MRTIVLVAVLCSFPHFLVASDQDLGAQLNASYAHKALIVLHPIQQNSQQYDSTGKLLSSSEQGPWTLYSPVEVTKIDFTSDKLRITGIRLIYVYAARRHRFVFYRQNHATKVEVEIELSAPLTTLQDAIATIGRIFTSNLEDLVPSLPDYWRSYFQRQQETTPAGIISSRQRSNADGHKSIQKDPELVRIGDKGVKPPKGLFTPAPKYPDLPRAMRIEGACIFSAIVGIDGRVHDLHIVRPLGAGLDEDALSVIQTWKFKPATRNGEPVPVKMSLEVAFRLYK